MPRLPINSWMAMAGLLALAAMLASGPVAAASSTKTSQPTVETLMYNMLRDSKVSKASKFYKTSVQGAMLYYSCPAEYQVDEAKKKRYETQLHEDKLALRQAFSDAHALLTTKLPSGEAWMAIDAHIKKLTDQQAIIVAQAIEKRGCLDGNFRRLDNYFEKLAQSKQTNQNTSSH